MELKPEEIKGNWEKLMGYISQYISSPRKEKLLDFYKKYEDRLILMPASHRKEYHNAIPGGYIDHVLRVLEIALATKKIWESFGSDTSGFTEEELVFSAINHDLGKMGDEHHEAYLPQDDKWRKEKLGEDYKHNTALPFTGIPERSLYLLQAHGIIYTLNEMIAITTHDGMFDPGNEKYYKNFMAEQKPRNPLPYILHHADMTAARIEFEGYWAEKSKDNLDSSKKGNTMSPSNKNPKNNTKNQKALGSIKSKGLANMLSDL